MPPLSPQKAGRAIGSTPANTLNNRPSKRRSAVGTDLGKTLGMFLSVLKIFPAPSKQQEILDILLSVRGPTRAVSGCLECSIYEEHDEEHTVVYLEKWHSKKAMIGHIRSTVYPRVLKALELSDRQPEISFHEISTTEGIELIERERSSVMSTR